MDPLITTLPVQLRESLHLLGFVSTAEATSPDLYATSTSSEMTSSTLSLRELQIMQALEVGVVSEETSQSSG
jgi:hypothetical protein